MDSIPLERSGHTSLDDFLKKNRPSANTWPCASTRLVVLCVKLVSKTPRIHAHSRLRILPSTNLSDPRKRVVEERDVWILVEKEKKEKKEREEEEEAKRNTWMPRLGFNLCLEASIHPA